MKKLLVLLTIFCCLAVPAFSASESFYQTVSENYRVFSTVSEAHSKAIADKMEAGLKLFNGIFHFDLSQLENQLKVVIYADQTGFDTYLNKLLGKTRSEFVYIHYSNLAKSELVGYVKDDEDSFNTLLVHQGLIQFLKAFAPTAPMWMQEGIAAYVENAVYSGETKSFTMEKSLAWLDTLKTILRGEGESAYLTIDQLITSSKDAAISNINTFYPEVWGLVYFLMNSENNAYNRLLSDSIMILDPELTMAENSLAVKNKVFSWVDSETLEQDFKTFIQSLKTFQDLIEDGIDSYAVKDYTSAVASFKAAADIKPGDYFAYYYLGLIEYAQKKYYNAEQYYLQSLSLGADAGFTNYALGVNAYADNDYESAQAYLNKALEANSEKYTEKVAEILERIEAETLFSDKEVIDVEEPEANPDTDTVDAADSTEDNSDNSTVDTADTDDTVTDEVSGTADIEETVPSGDGSADASVSTPVADDATGDDAAVTNGDDAAPADDDAALVNTGIDSGVAAESP